MKRLAVILALIFASLGFIVPAAMAGSGSQYNYGQAYVDAWGGGPFVNISGANQSNNDFTLVFEPGTSQYYLKFTGNSSWAGSCIGDAYNLSTRADTSLDPCPGGSGGGGWGTNWFVFSSNCPANQLSFKNIHWNGWLAPTGPTWHFGDPWYANSGTPYCFAVHAPA